MQGDRRDLRQSPVDHPLMENSSATPRRCRSFHIAPKRLLLYRDSLGLPGLEGALRKFPKLTFIGHSQPFWAEIVAT